MTQLNGNVQGLKHPDYCSQVGCVRPTSDIEHLEAPSALVVPDSDHEQMITFALTRCDEVGRDDEQIVHPSEGVVTYGQTAIWLTADELEEVGRQHAELARRLRATETTPDVVES